MSSPPYRLESLGRHHERANFDSGVPALDTYFRERVRRDMERHVATCFVAVDGSGLVAGFYTLATSSIQLESLPPAEAKRLPRYPAVPVTLLGRLAVSWRARGQGLGATLLLDALERAAGVQTQIASFAVVVDAKDEAAARFYRHYQFRDLTANRLFLPMAEILYIFAQPSVRANTSPAAANPTAGKSLS